MSDTPKIVRTAVEFINRAVKQGWTRKVTLLKVGQRVLSTQVILNRSCDYPKGYPQWAQIIISFRTARKPGYRRSVAYSTVAEYYMKVGRGSSGKLLKSGPWTAGYEFRRINEACERNPERVSV